MDSDVSDMNDINFSSLATFMRTMLCGFLLLSTMQLVSQLVSVVYF